MTNEVVAWVVSIVGSVDILTVLSVLIAFLSYRHKIKKDKADEDALKIKEAEAKAKHEGIVIEKLDDMNKKLDKLEDHDEKETKARQNLEISVATLQAEVHAHINNKSIHAYKTAGTTKRRAQ